MNKIILVGRVNRDPDVRTMENGAMVAYFPVVTSETHRDKTTGERKVFNDSHSIVAWNSQAETAKECLKRGDIVLIEGKSRTSTWEKKGTIHHVCQVIADNLNKLGTQNGGSEEGEADTLKNQTEFKNG